VGEEKRRVLVARLVLHELPAVAKGIVHFAGNCEFVLQRFLNGLQDFLLGAGVGNFRVVEKTDHGETRVRSVEKRSGGIIGAPIITVGTAGQQACG
jgi:hypothetical protein